MPDLFPVAGAGGVWPFVCPAEPSLTCERGLQLHQLAREWHVLGQRAAPDVREGCGACWQGAWLDQGGSLLRAGAHRPSHSGQQPPQTLPCLHHHHHHFLCCSPLPQPPQLLQQLRVWMATHSQQQSRCRGQPRCSGPAGGLANGGRCPGEGGYGRDCCFLLKLLQSHFEGLIKNWRDEPRAIDHWMSEYHWAVC
jgi:hypothetical protein